MSKEPATLEDAKKDATYAVVDPIAPRLVPERFAAFTDEWLTTYDNGLMARYEMSKNETGDMLFRVYKVLKAHRPHK